MVYDFSFWGKTTHGSRGLPQPLRREGGPDGQCVYISPPFGGAGGGCGCLFLCVHAHQADVGEECHAKGGLGTGVVGCGGQEEVAFDCFDAFAVFVGQIDGIVRR